MNSEFELQKLIRDTDKQRKSKKLKSEKKHVSNALAKRTNKKTKSNNRLRVFRCRLLFQEHNMQHC